MKFEKYKVKFKNIKEEEIYCNECGSYEGLREKLETLEIALFFIGSYVCLGTLETMYIFSEDIKQTTNSYARINIGNNENRLERCYLIRDSMLISMEKMEEADNE